MSTYNIYGANRYGIPGKHPCEIMCEGVGEQEVETTARECASKWGMDVFVFDSSNLRECMMIADEDGYLKWLK